MSAIGSVIVMMCSFSKWFRSARGGSDLLRTRGCWSPAGLGHAGQLAAVSHLAQADPAQAELAEDGLRAAAALAAGVGADGVLRLASGLDLESGLRHVSSP